MKCCTERLMAAGYSNHSDGMLDCFLEYCIVLQELPAAAICFTHECQGDMRLFRVCSDSCSVHSFEICLVVSGLLG